MEKEIKRYLEWKGTYATRASVSYKLWLDKFIEACGNKKLQSYSIEDFVKFKHWLEGRYSSTSVQYAIIVVKNFFQFYKQQDYRCLSTHFIKIPPKIRKSHKAISESEFKRVVEKIDAKNFIGLRDSLIVHLLWDTGIRVSELCDMNISQIDENKTSMIIRSKKSQLFRTIVWSAKTHALLLNYLKKRQVLKKCKEVGAVFVGFRKGREWSLRITCRSIERMIKKYVAIAEIREKISPHSFRHGWAHKRRDFNAPLAFIQKGLGHVSPISTFIYEQYNDKEFEANANSYLSNN
ncbi:MAG: hypothetical protein EYC69_10020 [Bacteroidetes bacterium]|nr:MAG: hypothetical protein EYC69_10020 [Bacteroidota bacterium]